MWGEIVEFVGTVTLGLAAEILDSDGAIGGADAVGIYCVGTGGGASLPLFKTQIPTKVSLIRLAGRRSSSKSSI